MSTAPVGPSVVTTIERDITWIRSHVILALLTVALIAGSIIGGISLFESMVEKHDARVAAAQLKKENVDTATQTALVQQLDQYRAADAARDTAQLTIINSLLAQMKQQHTATAQQIKTDATLDAQAAAARLIVQTKSQPSDVTASNDLVTLTLPTARRVVSDEDTLTQAQADVANTQAQLDAQQILTSDAKVERDAAQKVIDADKVELIATIKADDAACNDRIDKATAKTRKHGFWFSVASFVGGIIVRSVI